MKTTSRVGGFLMTDWSQPAHARLGWHDHPAPSLSLVLDGRYQEAFTGRSLECRRFDVVVKPAGERHRDRIGDGGARCLLVELSDQGAVALGGYLGRLDEPQVRGDGELRALVWRCLRELRDGDAWTPLALEALVLELLVGLARRGGEPSRRRPPWLARALAYLGDSTGSAVRLADVAAACGVHPAHLSRSFRRHLGCTVGEYLRRLRVEQAIAELTTGDDPLAAIARRAGFYDQSHLHRTVQRRTGLSPAQLRRSRPGG